jgi:uncharacterized protein (TIGR03067 family)
MRYAVAVLTMVSLMIVGQVRSADKEDDKDKLKGTWVVQSMESGPISIKPKKKLTYVFDGDKLTIKEEGKADDKRTCKIDASKKPKEMDLVDSKKETLKTVYELSGDTLKIAYPAVLGTRPPAVDPKESTVYNLKREKK